MTAPNPKVTHDEMRLIGQIRKIFGNKKDGRVGILIQRDASGITVSSLTPKGRIPSHKNS